MMTRLRAWLGHLWPKRLAGQMIALVLLALVLSQILTFLIFADARLLAIRAADRARVDRAPARGNAAGDARRDPAQWEQLALAVRLGRPQRGRAP